MPVIGYSRRVYEMKQFLVLLMCLLAGCTNRHPDSTDGTASTGEATVPFIDYSVVKTYPHDTSLFTEGLLVRDGKLFESTGSPAGAEGPKSLIGILDLRTGKLNK